MDEEAFIQARLRKMAHSDYIERVIYNEVELGWIVRLVSGGPLMTVDDVQAGVIRCCWFGGDYLRRDSFLADQLTRVLKVEQKA